MAPRHLAFATPLALRFGTGLEVISTTVGLRLCPTPWAAVAAGAAAAALATTGAAAGLAAGTAAAAAAAAAGVADVVACALPLFSSSGRLRQGK